MKSQTSALWPSSSIDPAESGTNGIFVLAPGASVQSARSDGIPGTSTTADFVHLPVRAWQLLPLQELLPYPAN